MAWARGLFGAGSDPRRQLLERLSADGRLSAAAVAAIGALPREIFVPASHAELAYNDVALEIGPDATISAPSMVAEMLSVLDLGPGIRVLEIGSGSGYAAAAMAAMGAFVTGVEILPELTEAARRNVAQAGFDDRIELVTGDGRLGWPAGAPYDRVVVSAAAEAIFPAWLEQLTVGGLLVYPEAGTAEDILVRLTKEPERLRREELGRCRFVRLKVDPHT